MKILAVDTSTTSGSLALVSEGALVRELASAGEAPHAVWLMQGISSLLEDAGASSEDIDLFAVGRGPGSFTGLRIGVSTVKGLAWTLGKPVCAVSSLEALALNAEEAGATICPVLDARKKEVYAALYRPGEGGMEALLDDSVLRPHDLFDIVERRTGGRVLFIGEGLKVYEGLVRENIRGALFAPERLWPVRAFNVARLAMKGNARYSGPEELAPLYLRKSEAELKRGAT